MKQVRFKDGDKVYRVRLAENAEEARKTTINEKTLQWINDGKHMDPLPEIYRQYSKAYTKDPVKEKTAAEIQQEIDNRNKEPDLVQEIKEMKVGEAAEKVQEIDDVEILEKIAQEDERKTVQDAVEDRLEELADDEDSDEYETN